MTRKATSTQTPDVYGFVGSAHEQRLFADAVAAAVAAELAKPQTVRERIRARNVAAGKPAFVPPTAAQSLATREKQLSDQIAGRAKHAYKTPVAKLARLIACRDAAKTPEIAWDWFRGTQPLPDAVKGLLAKRDTVTADAQAIANGTARAPVVDLAERVKAAALDADVAHDSIVAKLTAMAANTADKPAGRLASKLLAQLLTGQS